MSTSLPTANQATIIIFAKAPVAGKVKTRLTTQLSPAEAAQLHQQLVLHTLNMATEKSIANVELWCAPDCSHAFFQHCRETYALSLHQQLGNNLGQRMHHAVENVLTRSQYCLIIGTDCPELNHQHFADTFSSLDARHDCVITPATDGGYVMLGLGQNNALLFEDIRWGEESVYEETVVRLKSLSWRWQEKSALNDIDHPHDLALLEGITLPDPILP